MGSYSQDFENKSSNLLGYVQSQLSQVVGWSPLPGQLNKIVASSAGYVWGFNYTGTIYSCREPCDGTNWKAVSQQPPGIIGMPIDIAVDGQSVYVLYNAKAAPTVSSSVSTDLQTGNIPIGDVGMPPGHINIGSGYVVVSSSFLGNNAIPVASAISQGQTYTATLTDNTGATASFTVTSYGTNPSWQGPPWMYTFYGNDGDSHSLTTKFAKSQTLSLKLSKKVEVTSTQSGNALTFASQPVDGSGSWSSQTVPGSPPSNPTINITDQFIFVGNQGCSKPCTTGNWVPISSPQGSTGIVAASSGSTYATVNNGGVTNVYSSSGSGQGGWTAQPGLAGKTPIAVEADNQFLYAKDSGSGGIYRCAAPYSDEESCHPVDTNGATVSGNHTISVNPRNYQTYIAASTNGSTGNMYQRLDQGSINYAPVLEETKNYTDQLDKTVNSLGDATVAQASALSAAETREEAVSAIKKVTDLRNKFRETDDKAKTLKSKILNDKPLVTQNRLLPLQIILYTLIFTIIFHFILSYFLSPNIVMGITMTIILIGAIVAYSYAGVNFNVSFVA